MSRSASSTRLLLPLFVGALAFAAGCTFEPPDSVLGGGGEGEDGSGNGGGNGGGGGGGGGGGNGSADAGVPMVSGETLTISYKTQPVAIEPGAYAPSSVLATWIEDPAGGFVETIDRRAGVYKNRLVAWQAAAGLNDIDAVTSASRTTHDALVSMTWEIPADLANGTYTIRMETADGNSLTADKNAQGSFTFEKDGTALLQPAVTADGYIDVVIDYSGTP